MHQIHHDIFEFDYENTPDTIAKNSSIEIYITGGYRPFTFATSSNGYNFEGEASYKTRDRNATLFCVDGTCGVDFDVTCNLTVTDGCGNEVEAVIRNTAGEWVSIETVWAHAPFHGGAASCNYYEAPDRIIVGDEAWGVTAYGWKTDSAPYNNCDTYTGWGTVVWEGGTNFPPAGEAGACWNAYLADAPGICCSKTRGPSILRYSYYKWSC